MRAINYPGCKCENFIILDKVFLYLYDRNYVKKEYNNKDNNKKIVIIKEPVISYDTDGVMLWNGKRCESLSLTEEEQLEMDKLLEEFK